MYLNQPHIPSWNFDYLTLNEFEIEKEELELERKFQEILEKDHPGKIPNE